MAETVNPKSMEYVKATKSNSIRKVRPKAYPDVPQNGGKEKWQNIVN